MTKDLPTSIVIFGASGDLTQRKLIPSLLNLCRKGRLPEQFRIIGYGSKEFSADKFRTHLEEGVKEFASFKFNEEEWSSFAPNIFYYQGSYDKESDFKKLSHSLSAWEKGAANRVYYMATPPGAFLN